MKIRRLICSALLVTVSLSGCGKVEPSKPNKDNLIGVQVIDTSTEDTNNGSFEFKPIQELQELPEGNVVNDRKVVRLYVGDNQYYPLTLPAYADYVTDYSTYIYDKNSAWSLQVVTNPDPGALSKATWIRDSMPLSKSVVRSKPNTKGNLEAACYLSPEKAIILRVYTDSDLYATVLDGLVDENNTIQTTNECMWVNTDKESNLPLTDVYEGLPVYSAESNTGVLTSRGNEEICNGTVVVPNIDNTVQRVYSFESGSLTVLMEYKKFDDATNLMYTKLAVVSADDYIADGFTSSDNMRYMEEGNYTIGVYKVNFNTTMTLFGEGYEARRNIVAFLYAQLLDEVSE